MTINDAKIILEAIQDSKKFKPNSVEQTFLSNVYSWINSGKRPTPKQSEWLHNIYRKAYDDTKIS